MPAVLIMERLRRNAVYGDVYVKECMKMIVRLYIRFDSDQIFSKLSVLRIAKKTSITTSEGPHTTSQTRYRI